MPDIRRSAGPRRGPKWASDTIAEALSKIEALADVRPNDDPEKIERYRRGWHLTSEDEVSNDAGVVRSPDLPLTACGIDRVHREAVHRYLEAWVIPQLRDTLDALNGKKIQYDSTILDYPIY